MKIKKSNFIGYKKKSWTVHPYAKYAGAAIQAGKLAYRGYQAYQSYRGRGGSNGERAVTNQHDVHTQYRFKRMPYRKRKRWTRFVKKVQAVADAGIGAKTVMFNDSVLIDIVGPGQGYGAMHLYGRGGSNTSIENGSADLFEIFSNDPDLKDASIGGGIISTNGKAHFLNATIDITMYNPSTATLEVDVYKLSYIPMERNIASFSAAISRYNFEQQDLSRTSNGGKIELSDRGATPFAMATLQSILGSKVVWKKKFLIGGNQSAFFQHRDPKNRWILTHDMNQVDVDFTHKYATVTYLFVAKEVSANPLATYNLRIGSTRTYQYKNVNKQQINRLNQLL